MEKPVSRSILLTHIATLHFQFGMSQTEIARRLGLSKMTVSRSIKRAFERGLVRVVIDEPFSDDAPAARQLGARFPAVSFTVVVPDAESDVDAIGGAFAFRFMVDADRGSTIGIGMGSTVASFVANLTTIRFDDMQLVQLIGGLPEAGQANPFAILNAMTQKLSASGVHFSTIALVDSREVRDSLVGNLDDPYAAPALWKHLDTAIFGIGRIAPDDPRTSLLNPRLAGEEDVRQLLESGAAAELLGHCIEPGGSLVATSLSDRIATIPIDALRSVPRRIALAGGSAKAEAIAAALRSGFVTELYTDRDCACRLLELLR